MIVEMGFFPFPEDAGASGASGALVCNEQFYKPMANGTLVYFSSHEITYVLNDTTTYIMGN